MKTQNFKKWFENKGYKFEDDDFWMEEIITDHKFKDIIELINDYCDERESYADQTNQTDNKALHIADVSNSSDKQKYQVYLNGLWIADCDTFEEAETIANGNAMNGTVNIERN